MQTSRLEQHHELLEEQIDVLKTAFHKVDARQSGMITKQQLAQIFVEIGMPKTPEEVATIFKEIDDNHNGLIEECEFMDYMKRLKRTLDLTAYTQKLFDQLVASASGSGSAIKGQFLSKQLMESMLSRLDPTVTKQEFELMWLEIDTDFDGNISRQQFCQFMTGRKP